MAFQSVQLIAGINVQRTLSLNEAGMADSNLVRFKEGLVQKLGGWAEYYPLGAVSSTPVRDLCPFVSLRNMTYVAAAAESRLVIISTGGMLTDITPQLFDTTPTPSFSVSSGSNIVTVVDPGSSMSIYGAIRIDTPIVLDTNILLQGGYPINTVLDPNTYTITAPSAASTTVSSGGTLATFATTNGTAVADVFLSNNKFIAGNYYQFEAPTQIAGQTIQGPYFISNVIDSTHAQFTLTQQASATATATMNGGLAAIHHYMVQGPAPTQAPYGLGLYGAGAYGIGVPPSQGTGVTIDSSDWSLDADGTAILANPRGGAIYVWAAEQALQNAQPVVQGGAPLKANGCFVSQPQQMVIAWGAQSLITGVQDPNLIRWSDTDNYNQWTPGSNNNSGSFRIPTGAMIRGAIQAPLYMVFWTDIDVWVAQWVGFPIVWSFTHMGAGCGLVGPHAAGILAGSVFWMGLDNLFTLGSSGVSPLPCPVWDFIFQQIDTNNISKVLCAANSAFSEIAWYFPIKDGTGENQAYAKVHISGNEYEWDVGFLDRTAWMDVSAAGPPIGADSMSNIMQHEVSFDASDTPLNSSVETGYFAIGDGRMFAIIDFVIPDFIWSTFGNATSGQITITFFAVDFPGDTERVYGPYVVSKGSEYIGTRIRGRLMRMRFESHDLGSFWRIGRLRYRWAVDGAR